MLRKRFAVILTIVFVNILLAASTPIYPFAYDLNLRNKVSEDGNMYKPNATDKGPVSSKIFELHPQLAFLGNFNGKFWYIERTLVPSWEAQQGCYDMGMKPPMVNQEELNFLYSVTSSGDDYSWLGAYMSVGLNSFRWIIDSSTPTGIPFYYQGISPNIRLVMDRWTPNAGVLAKDGSEEHYYFCSLP